MTLPSTPRQRGQPPGRSSGLSPAPFTGPRRDPATPWDERGALWGHPPAPAVPPAGLRGHQQEAAEPRPGRPHSPSRTISAPVVFLTPCSRRRAGARASSGGARASRPWTGLYLRPLSSRLLLPSCRTGTALYHRAAPSMLRLTTERSDLHALLGIHRRRQQALRKLFSHSTKHSPQDYLLLQ